MKKLPVEIYTDGACSGNPGPGGWAAVIISGEAEKEIYGFEQRTTSQRMELRAAIEALQALPGPALVNLYSDSAYLVNAFHQGWLERWYCNGWQTAAGKPVKNRDLWSRLLELTSRHRVTWHKVAGHSHNRYNNRCDELARLAISEKTSRRNSSPAAGPAARKPTSGSNRRRLAILTGGGDCPGLNAVIRAVAKSCFYRHDIEVIGFNNGFKGLVENDAWLISEEAVSGILHRGGTILGTTNRDNPFQFRVKDRDGTETVKDCSGEAIRHLEQWGVEGLIVVGGEGSLALGYRFSELGVPVIGIPKTIDNDLPGTDVTFGFDTAVSTASEAIDRLHTTAESHHRVMVLEVMGRNAGWIALHAGLAGGGDIILIPELPFSYEPIVAKIEERLSRGKKFSIVVAAEGAYPAGGTRVYQTVAEGSAPRLGGIAQQAAVEIEKRTGIESRATVLGHLQRGGTPTAFDRILATRFGVRAAELAAAGRWNEMVCLQNGQINSIPLDEAVSEIKRVDPDSELVVAACSVGTCFGREILPGK